MTHYFSRLTITRKGIEDIGSKMVKGAYPVHKEVWSMFPDNPDVQRDYVYCVMDGGRTIYCVSAREPRCDTGNWMVEVKRYEPIIHDGDIYRFYTCVNPTVANDSTGKHQRHDVVMDLKRKVRESGEPVDMREIIQKSVTDWFIRKGTQNGFEPIAGPELEISAYRRNESYKAGVQKITFSTVIVEGYLRVTDSEAFYRVLYGGIGSAKGFGCGMLMIKRP